MIEEYNDNVIYNYKSFEITLIKHSESVTIRCFETILYKIYEETYNLRMIEMFNVQNVDNFYVILNKSIEHLIKNCNNDVDTIDAVNVVNKKTNIKFICSENVIELKINLIYFILQFSFELEINLLETVHITGQDLVIKKLEREINELKLVVENVKEQKLIISNLEREIGELKLFVDNMKEQNLVINNLEREIGELKLFVENVPFIVMNNMFTSCYYANNSMSVFNRNQYLLLLNTNFLRLHFESGGGSNDKYINHINLPQNKISGNIHFPTMDQRNQKFNTNLKLIKIKTLYLIEANYDFGYENLPDSIEHIQLTFSDNEHLISCKNYLIERNLPNFHTMEFIDCNCNLVESLKQTYVNFAQPLNLKKVIMTNVNAFNEERLLKSNGIKCIIR
jgi:hypothetical protein